MDNGADKNIKTDYGKKPIDVARYSEMKALLGGRDQSGKPVLELSKFLKSSLVTLARVLPLGFAFLPRRKPVRKIL